MFRVVRTEFGLTNIFNDIKTFYKIVIILNVKNIIFIFTISLILFCGCSKSNEPARSALCEELSDTDYKIISDILEQYLEQTEGSSWRKRDNIFNEFTQNNTNVIDMVVMDDSTTNIFDGSSRSISRIRKKPIDEIMALREKLDLLNEKCCKIDSSKITSVKVHGLNEFEYNKIFRNTNFQFFYDNFPKAFEVFQISRPVYSNDGKEGLIYISVARDGKWGRGDLVRIMKKGDKWVISRIDEHWVS